MDWGKITPGDASIAGYYFRLRPSLPVLPVDASVPSQVVNKITIHERSCGMCGRWYTGGCAGKIDNCSLKSAGPPRSIDQNVQKKQPRQRKAINTGMVQRPIVSAIQEPPGFCYQRWSNQQPARQTLGGASPSTCVSGKSSTMMRFSSPSSSRGQYLLLWSAWCCCQVTLWAVKDGSILIVRMLCARTVAEIWSMRSSAID